MWKGGLLTKAGFLIYLGPPTPCKQALNYRCCLRFSYLAPYWLISRNTITFHKYFWCSRFCEFHSKSFPGLQNSPYYSLLQETM